MFERFSDQARRALLLAEETARERKALSVDVDHVVLGVLAQSASVAVRALAELDVDADDLSDRIRQALPPPGGAGVARPPFTGRAKALLDIARREALEAGREQVGPEHVLLAAVRAAEGAAGTALAGFGVELGPLRSRVLNLADEETAGEIPARPRAAAGAGDPAAAYMAAAEAQPEMDRDEEVRLAQAFEAGRAAHDGTASVEDRERRRLVKGAEEAGTQLARAHQRVVADAVRRFEGAAPLGQLVQAGNGGLLRAVESFDWRAGARFADHARPLVEAEVARVAGATGSVGLRLERYSGEEPPGPQ